MLVIALKVRNALILAPPTEEKASIVELQIFNFPTRGFEIDVENEKGM